MAWVFLVRLCLDCERHVLIAPPGPLWPEYTLDNQV